MRLLVLAALLAIPSVAQAEPSPSAMCRSAISAAEKQMGVPDRLMQSIGAVESGRRNEAGTVSAWPWTINAEGVGAYFSTKAEAIAAVVALRARGVRSIDVGCMQVNQKHHPDAFSSLEEAFDPGANARYAARFLIQLLAKTGSWPAATAGYHSLTPGIGEGYAQKVLALWAKPPTDSTPGADMPIRQASIASSSPPSLPPAGSSLSAGSARIIPMASPAGGLPGMTVGRGLDAYRSAPTRLVARVMPGRINPNS